MQYMKLNATSNVFEVEFLLNHIRNENSYHIHSTYIKQSKKFPQNASLLLTHGKVMYGRHMCVNLHLLSLLPF